VTDRQPFFVRFRRKTKKALIGSDTLNGKHGNGEWEQWQAEQTTADKQAPRAGVAT